MNKAELHDFIAKNQPNICQMAIYFDGRAVYSDEWNGYTETDCTHIISGGSSILRKTSTLQSGTAEMLYM